MRGGGGLIWAIRGGGDWGGTSGTKEKPPDFRSQEVDTSLSVLGSVKNVG